MNLRKYSNDKQRRYVRFKSSRGCLVGLRMADNNGKLFQCDGLILNESFGGISLVITTDYQPQLQEVCYLNISGIGQVKARVAWCKKLSSRRFSLGLEYLA